MLRYASLHSRTRCGTDGGAADHIEHCRFSLPAWAFARDLSRSVLFRTTPGQALRLVVRTKCRLRKRFRSPTRRRFARYRE